MSRKPDESLNLAESIYWIALLVRTGLATESAIASLAAHFPQSPLAFAAAKLGGRMDLGETYLELARNSARSEQKAFFSQLAASSFVGMSVSPNLRWIAEAYRPRPIDGARALKIFELSKPMLKEWGADIEEWGRFLRGEAS